MSRGIGLGPVFEVEWLTTSRKWQVYAGRALFVFALLAGMTVVCFRYMDGRNLTMQVQANVGGSVFEVIVVMQLALVLLVAPASTAGTICLDKARGNLAHLFATDLSDAEIVLGKLAARLVPVLGCVFCTLPVLALTTLLGGIDPVGLTGAFIITVAVAVLGCAVAMCLSVWASKAHEVLMGTCLIWAAWLLLAPMWHAIDQIMFGLSLPPWVEWISLFDVALGSVGPPNQSIFVEQLMFAGGVLLVAMALVGVTVWRMRPVAIRQMGRGAVRKKHPSTASGRRLRLPGPALDPNPVLWREWHKQKPSRWVRVVGTIYYAVVGFFTALCVFVMLSKGSTGGLNGEFAALVAAFSVSIGMLLVAVRVPTALIDERVQGSLDVLMTTPLSTREIVEGKWWGGFRTSAMLAICPGILSAVALVRYLMQWTSHGELRIALLFVPSILVCWIVSYATFLTSLGLALATWMKKLGRALMVTVAIHVGLTVGLPLSVFALDGHERSAYAIACGSSFWGPGLLTVSLESPGGNSVEFIAFVFGAFLWSVGFLVAAVLLLLATVATFDHCMGRSTLGSTPQHDPPRRKSRVLARIE